MLPIPMARPKKYPDELIQRGVRLALESDRPIAHIAHDLGMHPETLRKRVRQAEADSGARPELLSSSRSARRSGGCARRTTSCGARTRSSSRRRCFSPRSSTQTDRSEPLHRRASRPLRGRADLPDPGRVGVRLLPARQRPRSRRRGRGRAAARADPRAARGQLLRLRLPADVEGAAAGRRAGGRAAASAADAHATGSCGAKRRGKPWRTTGPIRPRAGAPIWSSATSPPSGPNELWVADLTYLRCWEGVVFFAFVIDAYSRRIVGWQLAGHMRTTLVLDALRMALHQRGAAPTSSSCTTPIAAANTPRSTTPRPSPTTASSPRSARSATPTTTRSPRASSTASRPN